MKIFFFLAAVWVFPSLSQDQKIADSLINQAATLINQAFYDSASKCLGKAIEISRQFQNKTRFCQCLNKMTTILIRKGLYNDAEKAAQQTLDSTKLYLGRLSSETANSYANGALVYRHKGLYDSSLIYSKIALMIRLQILEPTNADIISSYNDLGSIYRFKGGHDQALEWYQKALDLRLKEGTLSKGLSQCYNNMGIVYADMADYDTAIEFHKKSLEIRLKVYGETHPDVALSYTNLGISYYFKKEYDRAIDYSKKALAVRISALGSEHQDVARVLSNMGNILVDQGNYQSALDHLSKALKIRRLTSQDNVEVAGILNNLGVAYTNLDSTEQASFCLRTALSIRLKRLGYHHADVGETYFNLASLFLKTKALDSASFYCTEGIHSQIANSTVHDSLNSAGRFVSYKQFINLSRLEGEIYEARYDQLQNLNDLIAAKKAYEKASQAIYRMKTSLKHQGSKLDLAAEVNEIFERSIRLNLRISKLTRDHKYFENAFSIFEKNKAILLSQAIQESEAKAFAHIPDSLTKKEQLIINSIAESEAKLLKLSLPKQDSIENLLFAKKREHEQLVKFFETNFQDYYQFKYYSGQASVSSFQNHLKPNQAMIEFFDGKDTVYTALLTSTMIYILSTSKDSDYLANLPALRTALFNADFVEYSNSAFSLYHKLIAPLENYLSTIKSLIIVPDGDLNHIPFEALIRHKPLKTDDFSKMDYMANRFEISYHYSASLWMNSRNRSGKFSLLALAPVFGDTTQKQLALARNGPVFRKLANLFGKEFLSLPNSEKEIKEIKSLFVKKGYRSTIFLNDDAKERIMKDTLDYSFIHIATHGYLDESLPRRSGLLFSQADSIDDGILTDAEIFNLNLKADLVVLSACESGQGKVAKGEGILSLARGFLFSGANNLVVSLWQVRDASTAEFMKYFYEFILDNKTYSEALRLAKLKMIKQPRYANPINWAPFIILGH